LGLAEQDLLTMVLPEQMEQIQWLSLKLLLVAAVAAHAVAGSLLEKDLLADLVVVAVGLVLVVLVHLAKEEQEELLTLEDMQETNQVLAVAELGLLGQLL